MSYGFQLAGVPSLVYSLWEVDETATNTLLLLFYTNLKASLSKDEALHKAKIQYLRQATEVTADPYYWAGFAFQGDTMNFAFDKKMTWIWWLFAMFSIVTIGYIFRKRFN